MFFSSSFSGQSLNGVGVYTLASISHDFASYQISDVSLQVHWKALAIERTVDLKGHAVFEFQLHHGAQLSTNDSSGFGLC